MNQLVAATNHNVPDGTQVDFLGVKGSYGDFLRQMIGLSLVITTKFEEYESNGEKKKAVRLRAMKQLPTAADDAGEEEKPF